MRVEERLAELGIELPEPVKPAANYVRYLRTGNLLFISGTGPSDSAPKGKVGTEVTPEEAYQAAREVACRSSRRPGRRSTVTSIASRGRSRCWAWSTVPRISKASPR